MVGEQLAHYQQLFTAVLLQQCNQAEQLTQRQEAAGAGLQAGMRDTLVQEMLKAGQDTAALQALLSGCAAAVLRVGQALHASAQQQVVQDALQAMQDATQVILHTARDNELLQLVQGHVPAAAAGAGKPLEQAHGCRVLVHQGLEWLRQCPQAAEVWSAFAGMVDCADSGAAAVTPVPQHHVGLLPGR